MSDDALRAFERALATCTDAAILSLAPAILARARATPDLTAAERERVALEERRRIGERVHALQRSHGAELFRIVYGSLITTEQLAVSLKRGDDVPDAESAFVVARVGDREVLRAPYSEVRRGIAGLSEFVRDRTGLGPDAVRREIWIDGRLVWSRDPVRDPMREPIYDRIQIEPDVAGGLAGPIQRAAEALARSPLLSPPPADPICSVCGGRQGYPNSMTHHGAPPPCGCR